MNCERCRAPLQQTQGRFCSLSCYREATRLPRLACQQCQAFYAPLRRRQRFCSRPCSVAHDVVSRAARDGTGLYGMHPFSRALIAILSVQGEWFLTASDLAIWASGEDTLLERHRVSMQMARLRQRGFVIETRSALWEPLVGGRARLAYRLATVADVREAAA